MAAHFDGFLDNLTFPRWDEGARTVSSAQLAEFKHAVQASCEVLYDKGQRVQQPSARASSAFACVKAMLAQGISPLTPLPESDGASAFLVASRSLRAPLGKALLRELAQGFRRRGRGAVQGAGGRSRQDSLHLPVHDAVRALDVEAVRLLTQGKFAIELQMQESWGSQPTALHLAVEQGSLDIVVYIAGEGSALNKTDGLRRTPLHLAFDRVLASLLLPAAAASREPAAAAASSEPATAAVSSSKPADSGPDAAAAAAAAAANAPAATSSDPAAATAAAVSSSMPAAPKETATAPSKPAAPQTEAERLAERQRAVLREALGFPQGEPAALALPLLDAEHCWGIVRALLRARASDSEDSKQRQLSERIRLPPFEPGSPHVVPRDIVDMLLGKQGRVNLPLPLPIPIIVTDDDIKRAASTKVYEVILKSLPNDAVAAARCAAVVACALAAAEHRFQIQQGRQGWREAMESEFLRRLPGPSRAESAHSASAPKQADPRKVLQNELWTLALGPFSPPTDFTSTMPLLALNYDCATSTPEETAEQLAGRAVKITTSVALKKLKKAAGLEMVGAGAEDAEKEAAEAVAKAEESKQQLEAVSAVVQELRASSLAAEAAELPSATFTALWSKGMGLSSESRRQRVLEVAVAAPLLETDWDALAGAEDGKAFDWAALAQALVEGAVGEGIPCAWEKCSRSVPPSSIVKEVLAAVAKHVKDEACGIKKALMDDAQREALIAVICAAATDATPAAAGAAATAAAATAAAATAAAAPPQSDHLFLTTAIINTLHEGVQDAFERCSTATEPSKTLAGDFGRLAGADAISKAQALTLSPDVLQQAQAMVPSACAGAGEWSRAAASTLLYLQGRVQRQVLACELPDTLCPRFDARVAAARGVLTSGPAVLKASLNAALQVRLGAASQAKAVAVEAARRAFRVLELTPMPEREPLPLVYCDLLELVTEKADLLLDLYVRMLPEPPSRYYSNKFATNLEKFMGKNKALWVGGPERAHRESFKQACIANVVSALKLVLAAFLASYRRQAPRQIREMLHNAAYVAPPRDVLKVAGTVAVDVWSQSLTYAGQDAGDAVTAVGLAAEAAAASQDADTAAAASKVSPETLQKVFEKAEAGAQRHLGTQFRSSTLPPPTPSLTQVQSFMSSVELNLLPTSLRAILLSDKQLLSTALLGGPVAEATTRLLNERAAAAVGGPAIELTELQGVAERLVVAQLVVAEQAAADPLYPAQHQGILTVLDELHAVFLGPGATNVGMYFARFGDDQDFMAQYQLALQQLNTDKAKAVQLAACLPGPSENKAPWKAVITEHWERERQRLASITRDQAQTVQNEWSQRLILLLSGEAVRLLQEQVHCTTPAAAEADQRSKLAVSLGTAVPQGNVFTFSQLVALRNAVKIDIDVEERRAPNSKDPDQKALQSVHHQLRDECFVLATMPWDATLHMGHPLRQFYYSATSTREVGQ